MHECGQDAVCPSGGIRVMKDVRPYYCVAPGDAGVRAFDGADLLHAIGFAQRPKSWLDAACIHRATAEGI